MPLKRHHKIAIGGVSSLIILIIILNSFLIYTLHAQIQITQSNLESDIRRLQTETNSKITELTEGLLATKKDLSSTQNELSSLGTTLSQELDSLKASAGEDFSGIIEQAVKGVVTIRTDVSQGTGFIITDDGYLVTNYHVIQGAKAAVIITSNSEDHEVSLMGYDSNLDLALLKISGNFEKLTLDNSENTQVGEKVIAIGNPLGLQFSVSQGIVSAIHRVGENEIPAYTQTDAALNPGNSGGPLINTQGKVIGINNFKIGEGESLGFALESNYIKKGVNTISQQALNQTLI